MSTGDITNRVTLDADLYQEGISEKVGLIFQCYATFIAGFVIAFTKGKKYIYNYAIMWSFFCMHTNWCFEIKFFF
jgi:hypothetical protein